MKIISVSCMTEKLVPKTDFYESEYPKDTFLGLVYHISIS